MPVRFAETREFRTNGKRLFHELQTALRYAQNILRLRGQLKTTLALKITVNFICRPRRGPPPQMVAAVRDI